MRRPVLLAPLLAVALLTAACAEDAAPPIGPGTTSPVTTTAATTSPVATSPEGTSPVTTSPATTTPAPTTPLSPLQGLALEVIADGYANPVLVTSPPGDGRLFVVEKPGRIRIVGEEAPFLDVIALTDEGHMEQGLLGLAFHPEFSANGRFFVSYTDRGGTSTLAEYRTAGSGSADAASARVLLTQAQPKGNHNGGMLAFGPDGYLYMSLGDGGGADDRFGNGQRPDTLLGTLLRLDVDSAEPYAIPPDNPFVDGGGAMEVWAYGLRNPWRFSFDGDLLFIGDVGQRLWEEIDVAPAAAGGINYGWPIMEGAGCFERAECDDPGTVFPVLVYGHDEGCSVTGGYVYRGAAIPELVGHYFYADWCGGWVRSFRYEGGAAVDGADWTSDLGSLGQITSFGLDADGEIYVVQQGGTISRIVPVR